MVINLSQKILTGRITNYRTGQKSQNSQECLIQFLNTNRAVAGQLVGKKVVWSSGKAKSIGQVMGLHGRSGMVKVRFRTPVPAQAIGAVVKLVE
jgi:ribosomal protein L35AE/L33A